MITLSQSNVTSRKEKKKDKKSKSNQTCPICNSYLPKARLPCPFKIFIIVAITMDSVTAQL